MIATGFLPYMRGIDKMSMGFDFTERWRKDEQEKNWIVFSPFRFGSHTFFNYEQMKKLVF
jgi:hypothetical protein